MKPRDFKEEPWDSVLQKSEAETIAANIMCILGRTGNEFRPLSYEEYKAERLKDGGYSSGEEKYFNQVIDYFKNEDTAKLFSPSWKGQS